MVSTASTKPAKPASKTSKSASKPNSKPAASHPSWKDMIKECIVDHKDEARSGVSRATIKKYISEKYKLDIEGVNASQLNRAIAHGAQTGAFVLPKGPSGKVKLASKSKPTPVNENVQPIAVKKAPTKTAAAPVKKPVKTATVKKTTKAAAPAKKTSKTTTTPAKKTAKASTAPTKKTSSVRASTKKPAAKAAVAKAVATKSKAAPKSKSRAKKPVVV